MSLTVSADTVRALIPDGRYVLQCLEQRNGRGVTLTLALPARSGGHTIQLETSEERVLQLFQELLMRPRPPRRKTTAGRKTPGAQRPPAVPEPNAEPLLLETLAGPSPGPAKRSRRGTAEVSGKQQAKKRARQTTLRQLVGTD